jgi:hypothetical protein
MPTPEQVTAVLACLVVGMAIIAIVKMAMMAIAALGRALATVFTKEGRNA